MVEIGKFNNLRILKKVDFGVYLDGEDLGEILLPNRYVPEKCTIDDRIRVFIYFDSEDLVIATTEKPYALVGEFAFLKVISESSVGAFLDWGLQKDLLVPFREQKQKMKEGESYIVFVYLDHKSNRIAASSKLDKFLDKQVVEYQEGQTVDLVIVNQTDIGYQAIINNTHRGILYKNEVFQPLKRGQEIKGFIKKVREDKKIDLCLYKPGYEKIDDLSKKIVQIIEKEGGYISLTDKSSPQIVYQWFGVSKKTFKKAIGALYKKRIISVEADGIQLIKKVL
jgi:predicted RNA-binding protein (virulence factor B family)